jgi:hypothetical protein
MQGYSGVLDLQGASRGGLVDKYARLQAEASLVCQVEFRWEEKERDEEPFDDVECA